MASKTKDLIVQKYLELLEENDFDKISVTDLVDSCSISRQTFYYHFDDIDAMLKWAFEQERKKALKDCAGCTSWMSAIRTLQPMLERFNILFVRVKASFSLIKIQEMLCETIFHFTVDYYHTYQNFKGDGTDKQRFLVKYSTAAMVELVFVEPSYDDDFSYSKLFDEIEATFKN